MCAGLWTLKALGEMKRPIHNFSSATAGEATPLLPSDRKVHYFRSLQESGIVQDDKRWHPTDITILLLVLSSVGMFLLTILVMHLLFYRNSEDNDPSGHATQNDEGDARLGINVVNYLGGSNWLEFKSTSSGSSQSESSSDTNGRLPKEVGHSGISVCESSVSELSAYTLEIKDCRFFTTNLDLEKIDEEGQCSESTSIKQADSSLHLAGLSNLDDKFEDICSNELDRCSF
jgi:hypothetical protein